jgi:3-oxoacyl-[acyl-carrier-protein] synthase II
MTGSSAAQRVVVTGLGAITAQGPSVADLWEGSRLGRVAIRPMERLSMEGYRTAIAGEAKQLRDPQHDVGYPEGHRDLALDFALVAAEEAMAACGVDTTVIPADRWGVLLGTCNGGLLSGEHWYRARMRGEEADPHLLRFVSPQALAEALSGAFGLQGPVLSVDTACAAGANAVGYAAALVRSGSADVMLTGGTDALSDVLIGGFNSLESLSPEPAAPYSHDRQGLSLGEGSGMLVLVRADLAEELGLHVHAEVAGYGLSADGYHPTAPHPEGRGAARAIRAALRAAGVTPDDVRYVNSHGTGTAKNDPAETAATKLGLGDASKGVAVSSTKSMIGHLLGAAGAVEAIVTVKALEEQLAPPTANFTEPDPECDLDYVPNVSRPLEMTTAISNNFAFGGANATIVLTRGRDVAPPQPEADEVVITGLAALTPAGTDLESLWEAVSTGRDCTAPEEAGRIGRVPLDAGAHLSPKERRRMDRLGIFSVIGARLALDDAGLVLDESTRERVGVIFGTGVGPMESMERFSALLFEEGPRGANPAVFPNTVYNAASGQVAMHLGAVGPTSTLTAGHAAGSSSLVYASDLLRDDMADGILAVAADTLTDTVIAGYAALGLLDAGLGLSEAGVAVLLERRRAAAARGARVRGRLLGHGIASDALGVGRTDASGAGMERAIRRALDESGLSASDLVGIWTAAPGLEDVDAAEAAALDRVVGADVPRHDLRGALGEPLGAGGSLGLALAVLGWEHGEPQGPVLVHSTSLGGTSIAVIVAP